MENRKQTVESLALRFPHSSFYYDLSRANIISTMQRIERNNLFVKLVKGKVLVVGCGEGFINEVLEKHGNTVTGLDLSDTRLERASKRVKGKLVSGDVYSLPFENDSYETLIASEILEHLKEPYTALTEFHRVLKTKGRLILTVPNGLNPIQFFKALRDKPHQEAEGHYFIYTPYCLQVMLKKSGFTVEQKHGVGFAFPGSSKLPVKVQLWISGVFSRWFPSLATNLVVVARKKRDVEI